MHSFIYDYIRCSVRYHCVSIVNNGSPHGHITSISSNFYSSISNDEYYSWNNYYFSSIHNRYI